MASALRVVRILLWAGSALCLLSSSAVRGEPTTPPMAALVRVAGSKDRQLFERVRGQTSDLRVRLSASETGPLEPTFAEQLALGRARAAAAGAQLLVWFARHATRLEVVVADLRADRVLVRSIARGAQQLDKSAQEEAAALVVRSAVKASLLGEALGMPAADAGSADGEQADQDAEGSVGAQTSVDARTAIPRTDAAPEAEEAPDEGEDAHERGDEVAREQRASEAQREEPESTRAKDRRAQEEAAARADESTPRGRRTRGVPDASRAWLLGLGGQAGYDGATAHGHYGLAVRVGRARGRFEGGLRGGFGFKARVREQSAAADVRLARHRACGYLAYVPVAGSSLRVALAVEAGVHVLATEVSARQDGFHAEGRRALLSELGAELSLAYLPPGLGGRTGFAVVAGLEAFPQRVVLGYRTDAQFVGVQRLLPVQPVAALFWIARL